MKILVFEDRLEVAENWSKQILSAYEDAYVETMKTTDFEELLKVLNNRRSEGRNPGEASSYIEPHKVDNADVIVIDYDLLQYSTTGDTTGSRLAYLLRCFTKCGIIIVLNEYGDNVFDLRLTSPPEEFADLNIGGDQIGNPGLWQATFNGYRPWHWPVVPHAREKFELCVEDVQDNIEVPIIEFLGLGRFIDWMPQSAWDFISGSKNVEEINLRDFITTTHGGIDKKDRDRLAPDQIARVIAARIGTFLNSLILPEQSLLVDAPHLVSRFPSLLSGEFDDVDSWNQLCNPVEQNIDDLLNERLKQYKFKKSNWLWRPAWYWPDINRDEEIEEVNNPWTIKEVDWVFCEDISQFVPIEVAKDFKALVSPPYIKRFVLNTNSPDVQIYVDHIKKGGPLDPSQVLYVPQAAFSL